MKRQRTLVMAGDDHRKLHQHLFPGDGKEAAAILVCTRVVGERTKLLVKDVVPVPHALCARTPVRLTWPTSVLDEWVDVIESDGVALVLTHSHPTGFLGFSSLDDGSDAEVMPYLYPYGRDDTANGPWNGTAVMTADGAMRARLYDRGTIAHDVDLVAVYGHDINFYWHGLAASRPMAFGNDMRNELSNISVAVIGLSGTGSVVAEQLLRLGVGELIVIDDDRIESKNLNRILNSTQRDAAKARFKVDMFAEAAARISPATRVIPIARNLGSYEAVKAAADADIVFSCVDTFSGRHLADRLATSLVQPLIDLGVVIPVRHPARGMVIANICGRVDYVQPRGSNLRNRKVYTPELLAAEYLRLANPAAFEGRVKEGYMPGTTEEAPSVISVNMRVASDAVQELIARAYPYRIESNRDYARSEFDLMEGTSAFTGESAFPSKPYRIHATGLSSPLLGLPELEDLRC